jgi:hypothetical protein
MPFSAYSRSARDRPVCYALCFDQGDTFMKNRTPLARCRPFVEPLEDRMCPSGFAADTQLLVFVTLHSKDPNETGEGEPSFLYGSAHAGLPLGSVDQFGQVEVFAVVAAAPNETFSVQTPSGGDGDEGSATITVRTVVPGRITPAQAKALLAAAAKLRTSAESDTVIWKQLFNANPNDPTAVDFSYRARAEAAEAARLIDLVYDPPDPNFKKLTRAVTPRVRLFKAHAQGLTAAAANALNALDKNQAQSNGLEEAILVSFNRADGADQAQNQHWEQRQLRAARKFEHELAGLLHKQSALRLKAAHALQGVSSLASLQVTTGAVSSLESDVSSSGLPPQIVADLQAAGLDQDAIAALTEAFTVQDPTQVAGDLTHVFADPTLLQSLQDLSGSLRQ